VLASSTLNGVEGNQIGGGVGLDGDSEIEVLWYSTVLRGKA
jgi:hypothetical protein